MDLLSPRQSIWLFLEWSLGEGGALLSVPQAFNKNNLMLEERNKYFNPQLAGKTYTNAYFTDLNTYDDY